MEAEVLDGAWHGTLNTDVGSLRMIFHIDQNGNEYSAVIESVDQRGKMVPVNLQVDGNSLRFTNSQYDIDYQAEVSGGEILGTFKQFGSEFPNLSLERK